jgi:UrcA family protein
MSTSIKKETNMRFTTTWRSAGYLAVTSLGLALSGQAAAAAADDVVISTQPPRQVWHSAPDQLVSLTRRVSYADLDLSTSSGAKQLEMRVNEAANSLCQELERRVASFPDLAERLTCVKGAVADGMEHARAAISAAEKRIRTAGVPASR